jgi:hypothetical protein
MKETLMIILGIIFTLLACSPKTDSIEAETFRITVTNMFMGGTDAVTVLTQDSIKATWDMQGSDSKSLERKLNIEEKVKVKRFINSFPIKKLNDRYINEAVEDGTQIQFDFYIGNTSKSIFISNIYNEDLGKLTEFINTLLPVDYILYNRNSVPWE